MDKDEDVLLIVMTSHGNQKGFGLQLPGNLSTELTPQQVATALDSEGIKNRVVIVSACFAGIFMAPLQNDNTIVMTAADDKSTSFGCAPERDWTYFGDALFHQSLQPGTDFEEAFDHARLLIHGWELMDKRHRPTRKARSGRRWWPNLRRYSRPARTDKNIISKSGSRFSENHAQSKWQSPV